MARIINPLRSCMHNTTEDKCMTYRMQLEPDKSETLNKFKLNKGLDPK